MPTRPIYERFPGAHCIRSTIWFPEPGQPKKFRTKLGYEGAIQPSSAKLIASLQVHQRDLTPALEAKIQDLIDALEKA